MDGASPCPFGPGSRDFSKTYACMPPDHRQWLLDQILFFGKKAKKMEEKYGIPVATLNSWIHRYRTTGAVRVGAGRKPAFSKKAEAKIYTKLTEGVFKMKEGDYMDQLHQIRVEELQETMEIDSSQVPKASRRTVGRLEKKVGIKTGNAETTTNARAVAMAESVISFVLQLLAS